MLACRVSGIAAIVRDGAHEALDRMGNWHHIDSHMDTQTTTKDVDRFQALGKQPPFTAEGYSLSANAAQINYTAPGKGAQSCKA